MDGVAEGVVLYRNFNRRFVAMVERSRIRRAIDIEMKISFSADGITLTATDVEGITATACVATPTEEVRDRAKGESALRQQLSRSGDTIFDVRDIAIENLRFAPMSLVGALRREVLESLIVERVAHYKVQPRRAFVERKAEYPSKTLAPQDNVTNRIAREFYEAHGVEHIAEGLDCRTTTVGECVMQSSYCIRREIGECLREHPSLRGDLYIEHGTSRYKLCFDCERCLMSLYDHTEQNRL
jgi:putative protease